MTTYIHRYWLDPGSRGQSVYAANLQDKDNLSAARDLKLFLFWSSPVHPEEEKRQKCCLVVWVKGKVFPQQMGRARRHFLAFSSSISPAPGALN